MPCSSTKHVLCTYSMAQCRDIVYLRLNVLLARLGFYLICRFLTLSVVTGRPGLFSEDESCPDDLKYQYSALRFKKMLGGIIVALGMAKVCLSNSAYKGIQPELR